MIQLPLQNSASQTIRNNAMQRRGLQSVADIIPRLIKLYDMQAEINDQMDSEWAAEMASREYEEAGCPAPLPVLEMEQPAMAAQGTFGW